MTEDYRVLRQALREDLFLGGDDSCAALGGQAEWYGGLPGVYRALAAPAGWASVPAAPERGAPHAASRGYWFALHHLLVYRLGWSRPDRGLQWWYDSGKPTQDATLRLISEVWDRDRLLDPYLAWALSLQAEFHPEVSHNSKEELEPRWAAWVREQRERSASLQYFSLNGGWDPLHLTGHGLDVRRRAGALSGVDRSRRRATFVTEMGAAWYATLDATAAQLPDLGQDSWHVDVFVKTLGYLGEFRRSHVTRLWFTGTHSVHMAGN